MKIKIFCWSNKLIEFEKTKVIIVLFKNSIVLLLYYKIIISLLKFQGFFL